MDSQRRVRRKFLAVGATLVVALLAAACSSSGSSGSSAGTAGSASGNVTITLLESQQIRATVLQQLIPQFEAAMAAKGQHITVKLIKDIVPDDQT
ncbi:MAG TPA: hypothetical protein VMG13_02760, partial [Trebonia sp.]|nr:hypothetical protein [Trebonia sp.]